MPAPAGGGDGAEQAQSCRLDLPTEGEEEGEGQAGEDQRARNDQHAEEFLERRCERG
ncbi:MAG: hypothetical protein KatS3mg059_1639 [Thermomicrobiales bacterium]|nr:MAG: hypothetical protein KatS3mg059_1639 [Thermomicrobiales bacterium]